MDSVLQVEMRRKSRQVVGVMIHIVAIGGLGGATMATSVTGDHAIAMTQEEKQTARPNHRPIVANHG